jgi:hypothetical protein
MEFALLGVFGLGMFILGHMGMLTYARSFLNNPKATMTADLLLTLIKGPGAVPVVLCCMVMLAGAIFIAIPLMILVLL